MDNKYYVPDISEFHVGFEYERYFPGTKAQYVKDVFLLKDFGFIKNLYEQDRQDAWIRVKYLDKDDIESFGFVKHSGDFDFIKGEYQIEVFDNNVLHLTNDYGSNLLFHGAVKNKTKLKEILEREVFKNKNVCPNHSSVLEFLDCDICRNKKVFNYGEITMDQLEEAANYIYSNKNNKIAPDKRVMLLSQYCKTIGGPVTREGSFEYYYCDDEECKGCSIIRNAVLKHVKK